jgi:hypothetical protein
MEGVAKSVDEPERAYRGFVAVDDVSLQPMSEGGEACHGELLFFVSIIIQSFLDFRSFDIRSFLVLGAVSP